MQTRFPDVPIGVLAILGEYLHGVFGIVIVPRNTIVREECK